MTAPPTSSRRGAFEGSSGRWIMVELSVTAMVPSVAPEGNGCRGPAGVDGSRIVGNIVSATGAGTTGTGGATGGGTAGAGFAAGKATGGAMSGNDAELAEMAGAS